MGGATVGRAVEGGGMMMRRRWSESFRPEIWFVQRQWRQGRSREAY